MLERILSLVTVISIFLLSLMLMMTTPASAGPFGLLVIFISAYLAFLGLISFFLFGFSRILVYITSGMRFRRPLRVIPLRKAYYYSTILAAAPVMILGLQSVGSVGWYELLLIGLFIAIGCLYISRQKTA